MRDIPKGVPCARMEREAKLGAQVWISWVEGEEVVSQWGTLGGKLQQTVDIPGPKGKAGTKAYIDPELSAYEQLLRDVKAKARAGYRLTNVVPSFFARDVDKELQSVTKDEEINFDGPLPSNIAFSKPVNTIPVEKLLHLQGSGASPLIWTVKMNGMCYLISKDKHGKVWIQSRGKLAVENQKFPHLLWQFSDFLPPKSIVLCELFVGDGKDKRDFKMMQQISNSLVDRAHEMQKTLEWAKAYIFRIPYWNGVNMERDQPSSAWLQFIEMLSEGWKKWESGKKKGSIVWNGSDLGQQSGYLSYEHIRGIAFNEGLLYDEAIELMGRHGYEGWVVYHGNKAFGERHVSFLGRPDRPDMCWKVKRHLEDDFIAIWNPKGDRAHCSSKCRVPGPKEHEEQVETGVCCVCGKKLQPNGSFGSGKNKDRVGSLSLYQIGEDKVMRYVCEVSSGLTDEQKQQFADEGFMIGVAEIGYQDRGFISGGDDSNALSHPKVLRLREDKDISECVNEDI